MRVNGRDGCCIQLLVEWPMRAREHMCRWAIAYAAPGGDGAHPLVALSNRTTTLTKASPARKRQPLSACLRAAYYSCALNSFVHVLMYTHYLLAAMIGKNMKARRKYLWWSRYLTQFQMFQFVTMMVQVRAFNIEDAAQG